VLLLIGEAKYKFVLGGERRTFWMGNSKTRSMLLTSATPTVAKSFKNRKDRLISAFPLMAAFHGVEEVV